MVLVTIRLLDSGGRMENPHGKDMDNVHFDEFYGLTIGRVKYLDHCSSFVVHLAFL